MREFSMLKESIKEIQETLKEIKKELKEQRGLLFGTDEKTGVFEVQRRHENNIEELKCKAEENEAFRRKIMRIVWIVLGALIVSSVSAGGALLNIIKLLDVVIAATPK